MTREVFKGFALFVLAIIVLGGYQWHKLKGKNKVLAEENNLLKRNQKIA